MNVLIFILTFRSVCRKWVQTFVKQVYSSTAIIFVQNFTSCSLMPGAINFLSLMSKQCILFKSGQKLNCQRSVFVKYFTRLVSARSILGSASLITFLLWSIGSRTTVRETNLRSSRLKWSQQAGKQEFYGQTPLYGPPPPPLKTDTSLLRTVCFAPGERKPLHLL